MCELPVEMFCLVPAEVDHLGPGHCDPLQPHPGQDLPELPHRPGLTKASVFSEVRLQVSLVTSSP